MLLRISLSLDQFHIYRFVTFLVEVKPSLGDDYPAVLRQMKANKLSMQERMYEQRPAYCLLLNQFTATGATLDEVRRIFVQSSFSVLTFDDIATPTSG
jgi:hypothetical protein